MHEECFYAERAFRAGALGYLTKGEDSDKVLVALRKVLRGGIYLSDRLSPTLLQKLISGSVSIRSTVWRGLSADMGSWNTIWT